MNPLLPAGDAEDDYMIEIVGTVEDAYGGKETFSEWVEVCSPVFNHLSDICSFFLTFLR